MVDQSENVIFEKEMKDEINYSLKRKQTDKIVSLTNQDDLLE